MSPLRLPCTELDFLREPVLSGKGSASWHAAFTRPQEAPITCDS